MAVFAAARPVSAVLPVFVAVAGCSPLFGFIHMPKKPSTPPPSPPLEMWPFLLPLGLFLLFFLFLWL
jgi:hypothetical protein